MWLKRHELNPRWNVACCWYLCTYWEYLTSFSPFFFLFPGCWLRILANNAQHLSWSHTHFLFIAEAAVPPCPLILNLCQRPGGLWKPGIFQTPPLSHCSCNGHTRWEGWQNSPERFYWTCSSGSSARWIFGKQGITLNPWRAWPWGPRWSLSNTHSHVIVLCPQSCSLIRCLSWKFMLPLCRPIRVAPIISTMVYILWTKPSVSQRGGQQLMWRFVQWPRVFAKLFVPVWQQK